MMAAAPFALPALERVRIRALGLASAALRQRHPEWVAALTAALEAGLSLHHALAGVKDVPTPRAGPWLRILEEVMETELATANLLTGLRLLVAPIDDGALVDLGVSRGAWVTYHFDMFFMAADGVVESVQRLGKASVGPLRVPKPVAADLVARTDYLHAEIGRRRNTIAHGGLVRAQRPQRALELFALGGGWIATEDLLASRAEHHAMWAERGGNIANRLLTEVDAVIAAMEATVPWDELEQGPKGR